MGEARTVIGYGRRSRKWEKSAVKVKHRIELTRKKINDKKKEDELEAGTIVRIKKRKLGRRKLENIWGEEKWEVEGRVKGTSAYKIKFGQTCRVENRINLRVTKD